MTIEQAQTASELLEHRDSIQTIQRRLQADKSMAVCMINGVTTVPDEAIPYIEEALEKAKNDIEAKIAEL